MPARASGLVDGDPPRLRQPALDLVESRYLPIPEKGAGKNARQIHATLLARSSRIDVEGSGSSMIKAVGAALKWDLAVRDRDFYREHLLYGGPKDATEGCQQKLARLLEGTLVQEDLCLAKDLAVDEPNIEVRFGDNGRHQKVAVEDLSGAYRISAFVIRQSVVASLSDLPVQVWLRNRATQLVGFRIDRQKRLIGEAWIPKAGLTAEEFQLYVRTVAMECDRFEYILNGRDTE
jgi:hypothetical protein